MDIPHITFNYLGSSYILIKKGLIGLSPLQLGSVRILMTTIILIIVGWKKLCLFQENLGNGFVLLDSLELFS